MLDQARAGLVVHTGIAFDEAAAEWLRYVEQDRGCKPTTLRLGELRALRWRDVDFALSVIRVRASYSERWLVTPKIRSVPLAPDVAAALAGLGQRERWTGDEDLVFPGLLGTFLDDSALRRRYKAALREPTCGSSSSAN